jgi:UDP-N-acetylglucosamine--N-acetylmuramyl-(pentapeptide) pyrophosphoryl-undecaprenol N-acetylglucosamine transferase
MIVAGGSGGHIVPGLAVAEKLAEIAPTIRTTYVTSGKAVEKFFAQELSPFSAQEIEVPSLKSSLNPFRFSWKILASYRRAQQLLAQTKPDVILGMGAMTSVPLILAAWRQGIPIILHEQNQIAGRATTFLGRFATQICHSFEQTTGLQQTSLARKCLWTGNPVRSASRPPTNFPSNELRPSQKQLLILGGSLGSQPINHAIIGLAQQEPALFAGWKIIHQTGPLSESASKDLIIPAQLNWTTAPFLQPMSDYYAESTVVICRAGAGTLFELSAWGLPAILIPFPQAVRNHQMANALVFEQQQAAIIVTQQQNPQQTIDNLKQAWLKLQDAQVRDVYAEGIQKLSCPQAAQKIAECIVQLLPHRLHSM